MVLKILDDSSLSLLLAEKDRTINDLQSKLANQRLKAKSRLVLLKQTLVEQHPNDPISALATKLEQAETELLDCYSKIEQLEESLSVNEIKLKDYVIRVKVLEEGSGASTGDAYCDTNHLLSELAVVTADHASEKKQDSDAMYAQIVVKDARIMELSNGVLEKEGLIMDLQETVREKEEVIRAKMKAIQIYQEQIQCVEAFSAQISSHPAFVNSSVPSEVVSDAAPLTSRLSWLEGRLESLLNSLQAATNNLSTTKKSKKRVTFDLSETEKQKDLADLREEIRGGEDRCAALQHENEELYSQLSVVQRQLESSLKTLEQRNNDCDALTLQVNANYTQAQNLLLQMEEQAKDWQTKVLKAKSQNQLRICELEEQLETLLQEKHAFSQKEFVDEGAMVDLVTDDLTQLRQHNKDLEVRLETVEFELSGVTDLKDSLLDEIDDLNSSMASLKQRLNNVYNERDDLLEEVNRLCDQRGILNEQLHDLHDETLHLKSALEETEKTIEMLSNKLESAKEDASEREAFLTEYKSAAESENTMHSIVKTEMDKELTELRLKSKAAAAKIRQLEQENTELYTETQVIKQHFNTLLSDNSIANENDSIVLELREENRRLSQSLFEAQSTLGDYKIQIKQLKQSNQKLCGRLEKAYSHRHSKSDLLESSDELVYAQQELVAAKSSLTEREQLLAHVTAIRDSLIEEKQDIEAELSKLWTNENVLKKQLADLDTFNKQLISALAELQEHYQSLEKQEKESTAKIQRLLTENAKLTKAKLSFEEMLRSADRQSQAAQVQKQTAATEVEQQLIADLNCELAVSKELTVSLQERCRSLESENEAYVQQRRFTCSEMEAKTAECSRLQDDIVELHDLLDSTRQDLLASAEQVKSVSLRNHGLNRRLQLLNDCHLMALQGLRCLKVDVCYLHDSVEQQFLTLKSDVVTLLNLSLIAVRRFLPTTNCRQEDTSLQELPSMQTSAPNVAALVCGFADDAEEDQNCTSIKMELQKLDGMCSTLENITERLCEQTVSYSVNRQAFLEYNAMEVDESSASCDLRNVLTEEAGSLVCGISDHEQLLASTETLKNNESLLLMKQTLLEDQICQLELENRRLSEIIAQKDQHFELQSSTNSERESNYSQKTVELEIALEQLSNFGLLFDTLASKLEYYAGGMEDKIGNALEVVEAVTNQLVQTREALTELGVQIANLVEENDGLGTRLHNAIDSKEKVATLLEETNSRASDLEHNLHVATTERDASLAHCNKLESENQFLHAEIVECEDRLLDLEQQVSISKRAAESFQMQLNDHLAKDKESLDLRSSKLDVQIQNELLKEQNNSEAEQYLQNELKEQLELVQAQLRAQMLATADAESDVERLHTQNVALRAAISVLEENLRCLKNREEGSRQKSFNADEEAYTKLRDELTAVERDLQECTSKRDELKAQLMVSLEGESTVKAEYEANLESLQQQLQNARDQAEQFQTTCVQINQYYEQTKDAYKTLYDQYQSLLGAHTALEESSNGQRHLLEQLLMEKESVEHEMNRLKELLEESASIREEMEAQVSFLYTTKDSECGALQNQLKILNERITDLESKNQQQTEVSPDNVQVQLHDQIMPHVIVENPLSELKRKIIGKLRLLAVDTSEQLQNIPQNGSDIEELLENVVVQMRDVLEKNSKQLDLIYELQEEKDLLARAVENSTQTNEELLAKANELQNSVSTASVRLEEAEKLIADLQLRISDNLSAIGELTAENYKMSGELHSVEMQRQRLVDQVNELSLQRTVPPETVSVSTVCGVSSFDRTCQTESELEANVRELELLEIVMRQEQQHQDLFGQLEVSQATLKSVKDDLQCKEQILSNVAQLECELRRQLEYANEQLTTTTASSSSLQETLSQNNDQISSLEADRQRLQLEKAQLQQQLAEAESRAAAALQNLRLSYQQQQTDLTNGLSVLRKQNEELSLSFGVLSEQYQKVRMDLEVEFRAQINQCNHVIAEGENQILELQKQLENCQTTSNDIVFRHAAQSQQRIAILNNILHNLKAAVESTQQQQLSLERKDSENTVEDENEKLLVCLLGVSRLVKQRCHELAKAHAVGISDHTAARLCFENKISEQELLVSQLRDQVAALQIENSELSCSVAELKQRLELEKHKTPLLSKHNPEQLEYEANQFQQEVQRLKDQLQQTEQQCAELLKNSSKHQQQIFSLTEQNRTLAESYSEENKNTDLLKEHIAVLTNELNTLSMEREQLLSERISNSAKVNELESQNRKLDLEIQNVATEKIEAHQKLNFVEGELTQLKDCFAKKQVELLKVLQENGEIKEDLLLASNKLKTVELSSAELLFLKKKLHDTALQVTEKVAEKHELLKTISTQQEQIRLHLEEKRHCLAELDQFRTKISNITALEERLKFCESQRQLFAARNVELEELLQDEKGRLEQLKQRLYLTRPSGADGSKPSIAVKSVNDDTDSLPFIRQRPTGFMCALPFCGAYGKKTT